MIQMTEISLISGARGALLSEYKRAIGELKDVVKDVGPGLLAAVLDKDTNDQNCRSVQSILSHVVHAGYGYAIKIESLKSLQYTRPKKAIYDSIIPYVEDIDSMLHYTARVLDKFKDEDLEEYINEKKIQTEWGQCYDIEQMMEHAIVHILRHRRQLEELLSRYGV